MSILTRFIGLIMLIFGGTTTKDHVGNLTENIPRTTGKHCCTGLVGGVA